MNNKKLPVLVLKNIILFPHSEIRLELENDKDKVIPFGPFIVIGFILKMFLGIDTKDIIDFLIRA